MPRAAQQFAVPVFDETCLLMLGSFVCLALILGPASMVLHLPDFGGRRLNTLILYFAVLCTTQKPALASMAALVLALLVLTLLAMLGGVIAQCGQDSAGTGAPALAFCAIPGLLFLLHASWGALVLLILLELSGVVFAVFAVSSQTHYDHYAINALFWASAVSCFLITVGLSLLLGHNGASLVSQPPSSGGLGAGRASASAAVLILAGVFVKIGVQPWAWWLRPFYAGLSRPALLVYFLAFYPINGAALIGLMPTFCAAPLFVSCLAVVCSLTLGAFALALATATVAKCDFAELLISGTAASMLLVLLAAVS